MSGDKRFDVYYDSEMDMLHINSLPRSTNYVAEHGVILRDINTDQVCGLVLRNFRNGLAANLYASKFDKADEVATWLMC